MHFEQTGVAIGEKVAQSERIGIPGVSQLL